MKTDSSGNMQWCKDYLSDSSYDGPGQISRVTPTSDGGFLVSFQSSDSLSVSTGGCLMKTDANGNQIWMKEYYPIAPYFTRPQIINSNIYLACMNNGQSNVIVLRTNLQGVPILANNYTSSNARSFYDGLTFDRLHELRKHVILICERTVFKCPFYTFNHTRGAMIAHWKEVCPETSLITGRRLYYTLY